MPTKKTDPHFLFTTPDELKGEKRGCALLEPRKTLKKFGPLIKFMIGAFCLAAKGAAIAFLPGLAGLVPGLKALFAEDADGDGCLADDMVCEQFDSVCAAMTGLVDGDDVDSGGWKCPPANAYKPAQQDFAQFILKQDKDKGFGFFGLKHYPNAKPGAGDGKGTPLWLCAGCYEGLSPHH